MAMESERVRWQLAEGDGDVLDTLMERLRHLYDRVQRLLHLQERLQAAKEFATEHPIVALTLLVTAAIGAVPIMCFLTFAIGTLIFSLLGFLCIEGFLLTMGGVLLLGALLLISFLALLGVVFSAAILIVFNRSKDIMAKIISWLQDRTAETEQGGDHSQRGNKSIKGNQSPRELNQSPAVGMFHQTEGIRKRKTAERHEDGFQMVENREQDDNDNREKDC